MISAFILPPGGHIAEDRRAVLLVTDDDAAFSAPGLTAARHAVTGWSAFCRGILPLLREPTEDATERY